eukprot:397245-Pelagomonas_calceolata.AAC.8
MDTLLQKRSAPTQTGNLYSHALSGVHDVLLRQCGFFSCAPFLNHAQELAAAVRTLEAKEGKEAALKSIHRIAHRELSMQHLECMRPPNNKHMPFMEYFLRVCAKHWLTQQRVYAFNAGEDVCAQLIECSRG